MDGRGNLSRQRGRIRVIKRENGSRRIKWGGGLEGRIKEVI